MQLDKYQQAAAEATEARIAVSASPGSGKTRTLVSRFNYLLEQGVPSSEMVLITFTRYAAKEISKRIGHSAGNAAICTYHSFALDIIKRYGDKRGWEPEWLTILDEDEATLDEKEVLKDLGLINRDGKWNKKVKAYEWNAYKEHRVCWTDLDMKPMLIKKLDRAWNALMKRMKAENCLTYGMIILEAIELMKLDEVREEMQATYKHWMTDESQDADKAQWSLTYQFAPKTLFVVADADQSIYSFRGARPELFINYCSCPGVGFYELPYSYRFGINIAAPANALIKHNTQRLDTAIEAIANNEGSLNVVHGAQYDDVAKIIAKELADGREPQDIAVLARKHSTLDNLEMVLTGYKGQIDYRRIGGKDSIPNSAEFRAIKGYLRLSVNPSDRRAFMAIAASEHLTEDMLWSLRRLAHSEGKTMRAVYNKEFPEDVDTLREYLRSHDHQTDYTPAFRYLKEFMFWEACSNTQDLVHMLAMQAMQDQLVNHKNQVVLGTAHSSKGLEWKVVLIIGANQKDFPSKRARRDGKIEESRRLFYTAITRAEEKLYLISGQNDQGIHEPSQFLSEISVDIP